MPEPSRACVVKVLQNLTTPSVREHIVYQLRPGCPDFTLNIDEEMCKFQNKPEDSSDDDGESGWTAKTVDKWTEKGWLHPPLATQDTRE